MMNFDHFENLVDNLPDIPPDSIVSRVILKNEEVNVTLFGFAAGQELTEHTASKPAILYFLQGKATLTLGDEQKNARNGSFVFMPAHLPHGILAEEQTIMLLILLQK